MKKQATIVMLHFMSLCCSNLLSMMLSMMRCIEDKVVNKHVDMDVSVNIADNNLMVMMLFSEM